MKRIDDRKGFTIIELLISTTVFTLLLMVVLTAVTQVGRMYYKAVTTTRTQEAARTLIEDIATHLQYSSDPPFPSVGIPAPPTLLASGQQVGFCIGSIRYIFVMNKRATSGAHAIWADKDGYETNIPCNVSAVNMDVAEPSSRVFGRDMLPEDMRLSDLEIQPMNSEQTLWRVKVRILYGVNDLLADPDNFNNPIDATNFGRAICKGSAIGTQFCAISELETTVYRRLAK